MPTVTRKEIVESVVLVCRVCGKDVRRRSLDACRRDDDICHVCAVIATSARNKVWCYFGAHEVSTDALWRHGWHGDFAEDGPQCYDCRLATLIEELRNPVEHFGPTTVLKRLYTALKISPPKT